MFFPGIFEAKQHGTYKLVSRHFGSSGKDNYSRLQPSSEVLETVPKELLGTHEGDVRVS